MDAREIYIFDLHNTLYDEVSEFGNAIAGAINFLFEEAKTQGNPIDEKLFFDQLSAAHAQCGSDWDDEVWYEIAELQKLDGYTKLIPEAVAIRRAASEDLTTSHAFTDTLEVIKSLKEAGHMIYVATEATQNAASDTLALLGLDGIVDAAYTWPYKKPFERKTQATRLETFPVSLDNPDYTLQKPHPMILGAILLDAAKQDGLVPAGVNIDDVFEFTLDETLDLSELERKITEHPSGPEQQMQAQEALRAIRTVMTVKDGPYGAIIHDIKSRVCYVGDSLFRDGFMARNAEVRFVLAEYGKKNSREESYIRGGKMLEAVTGWDKFLIKFAQEAGQLPQLKGLITPDYTCKDGFGEFIDNLDLAAALAVKPSSAASGFDSPPPPTVKRSFRPGAEEIISMDTSPFSPAARAVARDVRRLGRAPVP